MSSCDWGFTFEAMMVYHDTEWGVPVHDDRRMFEHLMMEAMQCGLSWSLMIKKREIFRSCFDGFDYDRIADYTEADIERIMNTEGMIRSRRKIEAVINNAQCFQKVRQEHGSFCDWLWAHTDGKTILYMGHENGRIPVSNGLSDEIAKVFHKGDAETMARCFWASVQGIMEQMSADKSMKAPEPEWIVSILK